MTISEQVFGRKSVFASIEVMKILLSTSTLGLVGNKIWFAVYETSKILETNSDQLEIARVM